MAKLETRHITQAGLEMIKSFEGFRQKVYKCSAGKDTIGYGHLIKKKDKLVCVTRLEAEDLLRKDVVTAERAVIRLIKVSLNDAQFDALVSFTFNLGTGSLSSSTLRKKINSGFHSEAEFELNRWVFAGGKKVKGLIKRRKQEGLIYSGKFTRLARKAVA